MAHFDSEFEEILLRFVLGVQGVVAVEFHEEALDVYCVCNFSSTDKHPRVLNKH